MDSEFGLGWPAMAQAAHQHAVYLASAIARNIAGRNALMFAYRDRGTLVTFGSAGAIGRVQGLVPGTQVLVHGRVARALRSMIYRRHLVAIMGIVRAALMYSG
jgi:NADH:ubiquinone reductase (H+-translocating)